MKNKHLLKEIIQMIKEDMILESQASDEAKRLGLQYASFGRWKDPKTGKVTHKSEQGKLVQIGQTDKSSEQKVDPANQNTTKSQDFIQP